VKFIVIIFLSFILFSGLALSDPPISPENVPEEPVDEAHLEDEAVNPEILEAAKKRANKIRETREKKNEIGDPCMLNPNLPVCK